MFREHTHDPETGKAIGADRPRGSVLPKVLAVMAVINLLRMVASHRRGDHGMGSTWAERKRGRLAELHRELHRLDDDAAEASAKA
jgi:hypothetical protein